MKILEQAIDTLNLPKVAIEKADRFLGALLGPAVAEAGQLIADKIRFRRYRNQIEILGKAEKLLNSIGKKPQAVSLKILVPLIDAASLEEDPSIQDMWAGLLASATTSTQHASRHSICIHALKSISDVEAKALQRMFDKYKKRKETAIVQAIPKGHSARSVVVRVSDLFQDLGADEENFAALVDNLVRLNLVERPGSWQIGVGGMVNLTDLGLNVLRECNFYQEIDVL